MGYVQELSIFLIYVLTLYYLLQFMTFSIGIATINTSVLVTAILTLDMIIS